MKILPGGCSAALRNKKYTEEPNCRQNHDNSERKKHRYRRRYRTAEGEPHTTRAAAVLPYS